MSESFHTHGGDDPHSVICPSCGEQGFDGQGTASVFDSRMYLRACWNCGTKFGVEVDA